MTKRGRLRRSWRVPAALCDWLELGGLLPAKSGPGVAQIAVGPDSSRAYIAGRFPLNRVTALEMALREPGPAGRYEGLISLELMLGLPSLLESLSRLACLGASWMVHCIVLEQAVFGSEISQARGWLRALGYPEAHYRPVEMEGGPAEFGGGRGAVSRYFLFARRSLGPGMTFKR